MSSFATLLAEFGHGHGHDERMAGPALLVGAAGLLVLYGIWTIVRHRSGTHHVTSSADALLTLDARYARSEIDEHDYLRRRQVLANPTAFATALSVPRSGDPSAIAEDASEVDTSKGDPPR